MPLLPPVAAGVDGAAAAAPRQGPSTSRLPQSRAATGRWGGAARWAGVLRWRLPRRQTTSGSTGVPAQSPLRGGGAAGGRWSASPLRPRRDGHRVTRGAGVGDRNKKQKKRSAKPEATTALTTSHARSRGTHKSAVRAPDLKKEATNGRSSHDAFAVGSFLSPSAPTRTPGAERRAPCR